MSPIRNVDPGDLRLPPGRQDGPDLVKYARQVHQFGRRTDGMPMVEVTEGKDGELIINNGVTRATRCHRLSRGQLISVVITEVRSQVDLSRFKRIRDVFP